MTEKVRLLLLKADRRTLTAERLADFYERLTGRKPTAQELETTRERIAKLRARESKNEGRARVG